MPRVTLLPFGIELKASKGENLLELINSSKISIESICGGKGTCGKCKIVLEMVKPESSELKRLTSKELSQGIRLACQHEILENIKIEILEESLLLKQKVLVEGISKRVSLDPNVLKYYLSLEEPSLKDTKSDLDRVFESLEKVDVKGVSLNAARKLSRVLRKEDFNLTVVIVGGEIVEFEVGNTENECYGVAFDVGTTTLVGYLMDLKTGKELTYEARMNPQIFMGDDVISRIGFSLKNKGLKKLNSKILKELKSMILELSRKSNIKKENIYELSVCGNTAMHHLFLGISPRGLAFSPYVPVVRGSLNIPSEKLNLPGKKVFMLPTIAGFVGADTVADILAADFDHKLKLLIDIGTNCEIVLGTKGEMITCSAAAGPAFEGAHIKYGMRAASGAIDSVKISKDVEITTIDNYPPKGITGSGLIDSVAEMLKAGIVEKNGRLLEDGAKDRILKDEKNIEFILSRKPLITITQKDLREIQLAKGAIFAAQRILMREYGIEFEEIDEILLAGAFGTHIPRRSAQIIGMIPDIPLKKIKGIGNAAGSGAKLCLLSNKMRKKAKKISKDVRYIEISGRKDFTDEFMDAMSFPHANMELFPNVSKISKDD
ncbi:MAG: ASKHA domain-containing protein [Candidatus Methanofastidiosia archaeon]